MKALVFLLTLVFLSLQYRLWIGDGSIANVVSLHGKMKKQQEENGRLKTRNRFLAAEVDALKHGLDGIEARARTQMGMIKNGETFYMIVED
ncbi:MAG: cell division protein FtsB [Alteromonadaceae bacterium]|nr:MAG: cell division protein FtsB [Alteromonadaceae bacterium]